MLPLNLTKYELSLFDKLPTLSAKKEFVRERQHEQKHIEAAEAEVEEREFRYWQEIDRRIDDFRGK